MNIIKPSSWRLALMLAALTLTGCASFAATDPGDTDAMRSFAEDMANRHDMDATAIETLLLDEAEHQQGIIDAISDPAEALPWYRYRPIFLTNERIEAGLDYWDTHAEILDEVEATYGVPPHIVVAIIGVETRYGRYRGRHRVLDALRTLAFAYPPRADFFRSELEAFLLLADEERFDPTAPLGSYAGAMGVPQFISSSYRAYAVDFDGNGRRDLFSEPADAMGSVGNYFARHGWEADAPIAVRAKVAGNRWTHYQRDDLKPIDTVAELEAAGVTPQAPLNGTQPAVCDGCPATGRSHAGGPVIRRIQAIGGLLVVLFLAGCSGMGPAPGDGPGRVIDNPQAIPDAVPRNAPPSRYGNPDTYEVFGETYRVMRTADGHRERGIASWYGSKFHGRRTSSGEPFDMYTMTAAHRSLPLPTWVEVRHLGNDRRIVVKVNDRGPFADNRIIDLSYAAAAKLGMLGTGTAPVEIRTVTPEENEESVVEVANTTAPSETAPSDDPAYWLQVAAFGERRNAERLVRELEASGIRHPARIEAGDDGLHRVRLGPLDDAKAVDDASQSLKTANFDPGHVIIPD